MRSMHFSLLRIDEWLDVKNLSEGVTPSLSTVRH